MLMELPPFRGGKLKHTQQERIRAANRAAFENKAGKVPAFCYLQRIVYL